MDTQAILTKYQNAQEETIIFTLEGGSVVVGEEVDSDNKLWYVIKLDGVYALILALKATITQTHITLSKTITTTTSSNTTTGQ